MSFSEGLLASDANQSRAAGSLQDVEHIHPPREGDPMYFDECIKVQRAVKRIQQHTADIRKEAILISAASCAGDPEAKQRVQEHVKAATIAAEEARRLLERPGGLVGVAPANNLKLRELTQQKLNDNLTSASKAFEMAWQEFQVAAAAFANRGTTNAATSPFNVGGVASVEMHFIDNVNPTTEETLFRHQQQQQQRDITDAEVEAHAQIVSETADQMSSINQNIRALQRAMVDLAEHTQAQGETLESIESHVARSMDNTHDATELLTNASQRQQQGNKLLFWVLLLALVLAIVVMLAVWHHSHAHSSAL